MKDYIPAQWRPSPNFTRGRSAAIDRVVIHITDGQHRLDRAVEHLCKPDGKVSAHFLVGQAGEVVQLVALQNTAWHCSGWNSRSVGIEHIARTPGELSQDDPGLQLTTAQLDASAALVRWLLERLRLPLDAVVPHCSSPTTTHHDCGRDVTEGGIWPWAEYQRRMELTAAP